MPRGQLFREFSANPLITTAVGSLITMDTADLEAVFLEILNVGTSNLDAFQIQSKANSKASFQTIRSTSAHYTSPSGILIEVSGDLTVLASGATGWLMIYPKGIYQLRLRASRASGSDRVTIEGGGS